LYVLQTHKIAPIFLALGALMLITSFVPFAQALDIQSQVRITSTAGTCGLRIDGGAPINYGTLANLQVSGEQRLVFTNTGTADGAISVSGSQWNTGAAAGAVMLVSDTHFTPSLGASYDEMAALQLNDQPAGIIAPQDQSSIYWRLTPHIADVSFSGDAVQTVRLTATC
jgi:hypothetical protein